MNSQDLTTIKVDKETRILARTVSGLTNEKMNDLILRLLKNELSTVGEKHLKEAKVKYNVS